MSTETNSLIEAWMEECQLETSRDVIRHWFELSVDKEAESREEANKIYYEKILPDVLNNLYEQDHCKSLRAAGFHTMVSSMGFSPETTIIAAAVIRPKKLHIVYSRNAAHSYDLAFKFLLRENILDPNQIAPIEINPTDHYHIYREIRSVFVRQRATENANPELHIVDITGGKKVMSATAAQAAWEMNLPLCYIEGNYVNMIRRTIPGTETVQRLPDPSEEKGARSRSTALAIYNRRNYKAAQDAFLESKKMNLEATFEELGIHVCKCYSSWTDLNLPQLAERLAELKSFVEEAATERLLDKKSFDHSTLSRHTTILSEVANNNELAMKATFLELAELYRNQSRHDFACLLAYRCIESFVEYGLKKQIGSDEFNRSNFKHDELVSNSDFTVDELRQAYIDLSRQMDSKRNESELPTRIGMMQGVMLLILLGEVHKNFPGKRKKMDVLKHIRGIADKRNSSILAHGANTLSEKDSESILELAGQLARAILEESEFEEFNRKQKALRPLALEILA